MIFWGTYIFVIFKQTTINTKWNNLLKDIASKRLPYLDPLGDRLKRRATHQYTYNKSTQ